MSYKSRTFTGKKGKIYGKKMRGDLAVPKKSRTFAGVFQKGVNMCFYIKANRFFGKTKLM